MSYLASAVIGSGVFNAGATIWGSSNAAKAQTQAAQMATQAQLQMFGQAQNALSPFIGAGTNLLPLLTKLLTPGPGMSDLLAQTPGFKFAQEYGQKAITNQASMRGLSGNALTAVADYATGAANQTYGTLLNALQGIINTGVSGAGALAGGAINTGGQIGSNILGIGNAQAGANMAQAGAIGGLGNSITLATLLQRLGGGNNTAPGMYGANMPIPAGQQWAAPTYGFAGQ
jgi:hypothetical protein